MLLPHSESIIWWLASLSLSLSEMSSHRTWTAETTWPDDYIYDTSLSVLDWLLKCVCALCEMYIRRGDVVSAAHAFHLVPTKMETKTWPSVNSTLSVYLGARVCYVMMYGSAFFWIKLRLSEWRDHRGSIIMSLATAPRRARWPHLLLLQLHISYLTQGGIRHTVNKAHYKCEGKNTLKKKILFNDEKDKKSNGDQNLNFPIWITLSVRCGKNY